MPTEIRISDEGHVRTVKLDGEARLNALGVATFDQLREAIGVAAADASVRVLVLTGAGARAFSAGVDIKEASQSSRFFHPMEGAARNVNEMLLEFPKPTIAAINGVAAGGGCELAIACDIRIASDTSKIGLPEARVGMGAHFASVVLPQIIGRSDAMKMLYTGDLLSAKDAARIGLVSEVCAPDHLSRVIMELADSIASNAPLSVRRIKTIARSSWGLPPAAGLRMASDANPYESQDRIEGAAAFQEKRPPHFVGS